ncbi:MAG: hypothetical protein QW234_03310, partial [Nitrososphaerota archaeon]
SAGVEEVKIITPPLLLISGVAACTRFRAEKKSAASIPLMVSGLVLSMLLYHIAGSSLAPT